MPEKQNGGGLLLKGVLGILAAIIVAGIGAGLSHLTRTDIHESPEQKRFRVQSEIKSNYERNTEPRLVKIEQQLTDIKVQLARIELKLEE